MLDTNGNPTGEHAGLGVEPNCILSGQDDLGLDTRWLGRRVHYKKRVGSTSEVAKKLAT